MHCMNRIDGIDKAVSKLVGLLPHPFPKRLSLLTYLFEPLVTKVVIISHAIVH